MHAAESPSRRTVSRRRPARGPGETGGDPGVAGGGPGRGGATPRRAAPGTGDQGAGVPGKRGMHAAVMQSCSGEEVAGWMCCVSE